MTVIDKLKELGYTTIPEVFYTYVFLWKSWYVGKVKGFHQYRRYNGHKWTKCNRASLGMAKKVCEDWANLLMNEKVQITLEGRREQEFVDRVLMANNFTVKSNEMQEMKSALGTVAYIPRVVGQAVNESGEIVRGEASSIELDYVTIEHISRWLGRMDLSPNVLLTAWSRGPGRIICICRSIEKMKTACTSSRTVFIVTKMKHFLMLY